MEPPPPLEPPDEAGPPAVATVAPDPDDDPPADEEPPPEPDDEPDELPADVLPPEVGLLGCAAGGVEATGVDVLGALGAGADVGVVVGVVLTGAGVVVVGVFVPAGGVLGRWGAEGAGGRTGAGVLATGAAPPPPPETMRLTDSGTVAAPVGAGVMIAGRTEVTAPRTGRASGARWIAGSWMGTVIERAPLMP